MMFPPYSDVPRELLANGIRGEARWEDDTVTLPATRSARMSRGSKVAFCSSQLLKALLNNTV
jgi:hypothetical protein